LLQLLRRSSYETSLSSSLSDYDASDAE